MSYQLITNDFFLIIIIIYSKAFVYLVGEDDVEKALELSGRCVGGLNIVVTQVLPKKPIKCGYTRPRT